jgi:hypothetical protein
MQKAFHRVGDNFLVTIQQRSDMKNDGSTFYHANDGCAVATQTVKNFLLVKVFRFKPKSSSFK